MRRLLAFVAVAAVAFAGGGCGSESSEPLAGDIAFAIDGESITPTVGAALRDTDATKELIVIGTRDISCGTSIGSSLLKGTYLTILIEREAAPGMAHAVPISFIRVESSGTLINGLPDAMVMLDALDSHVAGSVMFQTTGQDGAALEATGSFDVINCSPP